ncbi:MAG: hypothetical protein OXH15_16605 [Gammaproteobacteria bacterium]|nr:hypothetical protein [Gammaproteobacteria bacterium]
MNALKGTHVAILAGMVAGFATLTTAPVLGADDIVPQQEIENTYRAQTQGRQLYRAKKYEEAIPYLEFAAQRGFKQAQMRLGEIYVTGLGGVKQDIAQGIGWLGVAASGESDPRIRQRYKAVREAIPAEHNEQLDRIVEQYTNTFDGRNTRVVCEMVDRAGTHGKMMRCRYLDENLYPGISRS